jgi:RimJ/RimL family protein N-acetyltransferase
MSAHRIVPIAEEHIESFRDCFDEVARERRYLAMLEARPLEQVREFVRGQINANAPAFFALMDGRVVGWCDVVQKPWITVTHSGVLGMGVRPAYRGRGIGGALMEATLAGARNRGMTRVELTVRVDNERAKRLYERVGFVVEGLCRDHMRVDGKYYDSYLMAILLTNGSTG